MKTSNQRLTALMAGGGLCWGAETGVARLEGESEGEGEGEGVWGEAEKLLTAGVENVTAKCERGMVIIHQVKNAHNPAQGNIGLDVAYMGRCTYYDFAQRARRAHGTCIERLQRNVGATFNDGRGAPEVAQRAGGAYGRFQLSRIPRRRGGGGGVCGRVSWSQIRSRSYSFIDDSLSYRNGILAFLNFPLGRS
ncbi:hypothetical protein B0H17DRAFT_1174204 [Mycena rosella]|uniref:Uncharacterized protein n=1 Tax=Mycena rosella TaxID=1033263 RepID=A0AAD7H075_MYCRO|nr:hypothetical protein B0H17DRAFT_1174204 [Mycena rosella]